MADVLYREDVPYREDAPYREDVPHREDVPYHEGCAALRGCAVPRSQMVSRMPPPPLPLFQCCEGRRRGGLWNAVWPHVPGGLRPELRAEQH